MCVCSFVWLICRIQWSCWNANQLGEEERHKRRRKRDTHNSRGFAQLNGNSVQFTPDTLTSVPPIFFSSSFTRFSCRFFFFFVAFVFYSIPFLLDIWSDLWSVWMWRKNKMQSPCMITIIIIIIITMNASLVEISHIIISIYQKRRNIYIFHYPMLCVPLSARNMH